MPSSVAPITFFVCEDCEWLPAAKDADARDQVSRLSGNSHRVLEYLRQHGACFLPDIARGVQLAKAQVEDALWELVTGGLLTADGFDNLRSIIDPHRRTARLHGHASRPRQSLGRWALLHSVDPVPRQKAVEAIGWTLLRRYGIVFREILARESMAPPWRELLMAFRRLEDQGQIRGGRFVSSYLGEQFGLPIAVDSLRAASKLQASGEIITISAADPLNLVGIVIPGTRISPAATRSISLCDGTLVDTGLQTTAMPGPEQGDLLSGTLTELPGVN